VERQIEDVLDRLARAQSEHLDIISPRHFDRASQRVDEARQRYEQGGRIEDIERRLGDAAGELDQAEALQEIGLVLLRDALQARDDAAAANAPDYAASDWEKGERTIRDAGRRVESNDQNGARDRAQRAEEEFRLAELNAIRTDLLGRARAERETAQRAKAHERAPLTNARADSLLVRAEQVLRGDRYERAEARVLAEAAAGEYAHSTLLATVVDSVNRKTLTVEALTLRVETELARIAEELGFAAHFAAGYTPVTDQTLVAIQGLYEDRAGLEDDVAARSREIGRLEGLVDSLDAALAALEQREATVAAELRDRERRERRLREVQAVFAPEEAEVLLGQGILIIRLHGLTFDSGSDEIKPENFSLLTKVQRVIREFPEAAITVEGHTDSVGNEASNQALSRRRAIAVREYVLANMALSAERITAVGFGESRPVAPNNTEDGRRRNRRIEVTLSLSEG
jgi:outer membrane protein OmpA-like peptidoglycan-associated protein